MIFLDPRAGSKDLIKPLQKAGLPLDSSSNLDAGDLFFIGRGEQGKGLTIGIEHKKVADLVASLRTGRLQGHQLLAMRGADAGQKPLYDVAYLIVEGEVHYDEQGRLLRRCGRQAFRVMAGGMTITELQKRILVMQLRAGLNPIFTRTQADSIKWIESLYRVWTDRDLDQHKSHLAMYQAPTLLPLSQFRRTVGTLPGVGQRVSRTAEKAFGKSLRRAFNATTEEWAELETTDDKGKSRRFGMSAAIKVVEAIA